MKQTFKKIIVGGLAALCAASSITAVSAEGSTIDKETGSLTIRYFDDEDETIPVSGAKYTIYQVATIGTSLEENGAYVPLSEETSTDYVNFGDFSHDERLEYENNVLEIYNDTQSFGYEQTAEIDENGIGYFEDVPVGLYLVVETTTTRYHVKPESFLVSIPETVENENGINEWNYDVVTNPKQIVAGDLEITKQVKGKRVSDNSTFHVTVEFSLADENTANSGFIRDINNMEFKAKLADGTETTMKSGDTFDIKNNQTVSIYDIPAGITYKVVEKEANVRPYDTTYTNKEGVIEAKTSIKSTIVNNSSRYDTGVGDRVVFYMIGAGAALALLTVLIVTKKKDKKES